MTITINGLFTILLVASVFSILSLFHRIVSPDTYASIRTFKYFGNADKTAKNTAIRILIIIILTRIFIVFNINPSYIYVGIFVSCFLSVWPAIVQYRVYKFWQSATKLKLLVNYALYIVFSVLISYLTNNLGLVNNIIENIKVWDFNGIILNLITGLFMVIVPIGIESILSKNVVLVDLKINSFREELKILKDQFILEKHVAENYSYEIENIGIKNNIDPRLIRRILIYEYINRGGFFTQVLERIICKYFTKIAIKMDPSVGLTQIKISTAKEVIRKCPESFIKKLHNPIYNLRICGRIIRNLMYEYEQECDYTKNECNVYQYIASKWLNGWLDFNNPNVLLLASILNADDVSDGEMYYG